MNNSYSFKNQNALQKLTLEEGVNNERDLLAKTLGETVIPLYDNYWTCKDFTPSEKQLMQ